MEVDKSVISKWAAAAGTTAGALPIGADSVALISEETMMVIHVASLFGHQVNKDVAMNAIKNGVFGSVTSGSVAGTSVFASLNTSYPFSIPTKIAVATGILETLGNATYNFFKSGGVLPSGEKKPSNSE